MASAVAGGGIGGGGRGGGGVVAVVLSSLALPHLIFLGISIVILILFLTRVWMLSSTAPLSFGLFDFC